MLYEGEIEQKSGVFSVVGICHAERSETSLLLFIKRGDVSLCMTNIIRESSMITPGYLYARQFVTCELPIREFEG